MLGYLRKGSHVRVRNLHLSKNAAVYGHGRLVDLVRAVSFLPQIFLGFFGKPIGPHAGHRQPPLIVRMLRLMLATYSPKRTRRICRDASLFSVPELGFLKAVQSIVSSFLKAGRLIGNEKEKKKSPKSMISSSKPCLCCLIPNLDSAARTGDLSPCQLCGDATSA
ncbi:30S ribosomal protein S19 [Striga asiatica]|uniref:30S ribosomal protein S19 n=1 Tax=Striga asiatica TaxID=4170 RepID=A0A5A7RJN4_STRAF|nr:30S ribosomal protein S19 [Striga asiatica]